MTHGKRGTRLPDAGSLVFHGAVRRSALSVANTLLDPVAKVLVDVAEVPEGALDNGLGHAGEQRSHDVADEPVSCGVVQHLADQRAGLAPVIVLGVQLV